MVPKIALSGKRLAQHVLTISCPEANGIARAVSGLKINPNWSSDSLESIMPRYFGQLSLQQASLWK